MSLAAAACVAACHGPAAPPPPIETPIRPAKAPLETPSLRAVALSAGHHKTCAVANDGTVWCWGMLARNGASGVPLRIEGIESATSVALDQTGHVCGILEDGTVTCWYGGAPTENITRVPTPTKAVQLAAGDAHMCARDEIGKVRCWNSNPPPLAPPEEPRTIDLADPVTQIAAGSKSTCALMRGDLWCWTGTDAPQRIGDDRYDAVAMTDRGGICAVTSKGALACFGSPCTGRHSRWDDATCDMGITRGASRVAALGNQCVEVDGAWRCWGDNTFGQSASRPSADIRVPIALDASLDGATLALGHAHGCALTRAGAIRCWGSNRDGELGSGHAQWLSRHYELSQPIANTGEIASGWSFLCRVAQPAPWCWGEMNIGGHTVPTRPEGFMLPEAAGATLLTARNSHLCALRDGAVVCSAVWSNAGPETFAIADVHAIASTDSWACAITGAERSLQCWGPGNSISTSENTNRVPPTPVPGVVGVRTLATGTHHVCWTAGDDAVWCFGQGILPRSDGPWTDSNVPVQVARLAGVTQLAAGDGFTCALAAGAVSCWGRGGWGALGDGSWDDALEPTPVALEHAKHLVAGNGHVCAVVDDGTVWCWGRNRTGELGVGDRLARNTPTRVLGLDGASAVVAGPAISCAVDATGHVVCWGWTAAELFDPAPTPPRANPLAPPILLATGSSNPSQTPIEQIPQAHPAR